MGGKRRTFELFVTDGNKIHNNKYSYIKPDIFRIRNKIGIICPKHGLFYQRGDAHLSGQGCGKCKNSIKQTKEEYINKVKKVHGNKYDYSLVIYKDIKSKIKIICPIHGMFEQIAENHYNHGCPKCGFELNGNNRTDNYGSEFKNKANLIHNNKYDYSLVEYENAKTPIKIICPKHGEFEQTPNDHLSVKGCPICGNIISKEEINLKNWIENELKIKTTKHKINGFEIDIFIPKYNIGIEYDGLYWHSTRFKDKKYHLMKTDLCEKNNIQLIHVFEDEWLNKQDVVMSIIKSKLGLIENKIFARKCKIREINSKESSLFLNENHLQGTVGSKIKIGLFYNDILVSLMTFGKKRVSMGNKNIIDNNEYEMLRFCNKKELNVVGGASRLLKYFIDHYSPESIITFADRRYSNGNLYKSLGFKFLYNTQPNYFYFKKKSLHREYRYTYRKNVLVKDGYDKNLTEFQIMDERGFFRIYDSGNMKFILNLK